MLLTLATWTVLALPHAVGLVGLWRMDRFRRRSEGHLRRAALFLMLAVVAGLCYYTLVLMQADAAGWVDEMRHGASTPMATALYGQSILATATLGLFLAASTEAWQVTTPRAAARQPARLGRE